jgi:hypothetical protein
MPPLADNEKDPEVSTRDEEREFETVRQGLRKMAAYYRDKLAKAEIALAALEGKSRPSSEHRLNKAIKELLARRGALTQEEIRTELLNARLIVNTRAGRARVDRSLRQCVNAATLAERDGKFALPQ